MQLNKELILKVDLVFPLFDVDLKDLLKLFPIESLESVYVEFVGVLASLMSK